MVGTPAKKVTRLLRHQVQRRARLEARQHHDGAAEARTAPVLDHRLAEGVEERQHAQVGVGAVGVGPKSASPASALSRMLRCRELGALGLAGGAGRVEDDRGVVLVGARPSRRSAGWPAIACAIVSVPSIGDAPPSPAVITKKCSQAWASLEAGVPGLARSAARGALEAEVGLRVRVRPGGRPPRGP